MIALGDWSPEEPMQGIALDRLYGDLYSLRAVGIMLGVQPHAIPCPGVMAWESRSTEHTAIVEATQAQILGFVRYYRGALVRTPTGWIIKAIAPAMRTSFGCLLGRGNISR
jgi:hypothetical protein